MTAAMLPTAADVSVIPRYCEDDEWIISQKVDGHRKVVRITGGVVKAMNRRGESSAFPAAISEILATCPIDCLLDGELVGGCYWIFDLIECGDLINHSTALDERLAALRALVEGMGWAERNGVALLPWAETHLEKAELCQRVWENKGEGVVIKKRNSPYRPGRTTNWIKCKAVKTCDCEINRLRIDGRNNASLGVYDNGTLIEVGKVSTLTGDGPLLKVGDVVEVRYLDFTGSRLREPVFPRIRDDKSPEDCLFSELVSGDGTTVLGQAIHS